MLRSSCAGVILLLALLLNSGEQCLGQDLPTLLIWDCYKDAAIASDVLEFEDVETSTRMRDDTTLRHPETCMAACERRSFAFSGIRNMTQCWCGQELNYRHQKSVKCTYCPGKNNYRCGSAGQMAVYFRQEKIPKFSFLKCVQYNTAEEREFLSHRQRELSFVSFRGSGYRQATSCAQLCAKKGFMYAGMTFQFWCHCGNELPTARVTKCDKCQSNRKQSCGLKTSIAVYEIEGVHPVASICGGNLQTVPAKSIVSLQCMSRTHLDHVIYTWERVDRYKRPAQFSAGTSLPPPGNALLMTGVTKAESGLYRCRMENKLIANQTVGVNVAEVNLIVENPPLVTLSQQQPAKNSQPVTFQCDAKPESAPQLLSVQWFYGDMALGPFSSNLPGVHASAKSLLPDKAQMAAIPGPEDELGDAVAQPSPIVQTSLGAQDGQPHKPRFTAQEISTNIVFSATGTTFKLTIKLVDHRYWGNYTCRIFNPTAVTNAARLIDTTKRMILNGEVRSSEGADGVHNVTGAGNDVVTKPLDPCAWTEVGANGDRVLVVALVLSFVIMFLLLFAIFLLWRKLSASSAYAVSDAAKANTISKNNNATAADDGRAVPSVPQSPSDNPWSMPPSPGSRAKSYRFNFTGLDQHGSCQPISEEIAADLSTDSTYNYRC